MTSPSNPTPGGLRAIAASKGFGDNIAPYLLGVSYCSLMLITYRALSTWWTYIGFAYEPVSFDIGLTILLSALPVIFLPSRPKSIAELGAWVLSFTLFMPALLIPQLQGWVRGVDRWALFFTLLACSIGFNSLSRGTTWTLKPIRSSPATFWGIVLALWLLMHGFIIFVLGSRLSVVGIDQVYEQRANNSMAVGGNALVAYILSNASGALNPFLIAMGVFQRRFVLLALGIAGELIVYSVLAGKIVIVFIIVVASAFLLFDRQGRMQPLRFATGLTTIALMGALLVGFYLPGDGLFNDFFDLIFVRTLYLPGVLVGAYWSFFSTYPVTYFSHMILGQLFTTYPYGQQSVGQVIGAYVTPTSGGNVNNYNANFIAADGITGLGLIGIPIVFAIALLVLRTIDGITGRVDLRLRCAALVPFLMWLSDGSLFTALLTGGGGMIVVLLYAWGGVESERRTA